MTVKSNALVSVIMPALNAAPWIAEAIESCLRQTWPNIEIIVVDNGSTDSTAEIARRYPSPAVRVLECARPGASAARNDGLAAARGDFIQFLDADDVLDPRKMQLQLERLSASPQGKVASGAWVRFAHQPGDWPFNPQPVWCDLRAEDFLVKCWTGGWMMPSFVWLTPRSLIEAAGPWNESLGVNDDGEFFARVLLLSSGIAFCGDARGYYRTVPFPSLSKLRTYGGFNSNLRAIELSCGHLLKRYTAKQAYNACACYYQRFVYDTYPNARDLVAIAERRVRELGGCNLTCEGGRGFQIASSLFGWKLARHLQLLWHGFPRTASSSDESLKTTALRSGNV
jgi:glycosyltransferase involved in cell wall biosynthesis